MIDRCPRPLLEKSFGNIFHALQENYFTMVIDRLQNFFIFTCNRFLVAIPYELTDD